MPQIDTGPTDGPPGEQLKTAWVTLTGPEAHELLAALQAWAEERAEGGQRSGFGVGRRGLEVGEAELPVVVGADEEQVFALP